MVEYVPFMNSSSSMSWDRVHEQNHVVDCSFHLCCLAEKKKTSDKSTRSREFSPRVLTGRNVWHFLFPQQISRPLRLLSHSTTSTCHQSVSNLSCSSPRMTSVLSRGSYRSIVSFSILSIQTLSLIVPVSCHKLCKVLLRRTYTLNPLVRINARSKPTKRKERSLVHPSNKHRDASKKQRRKSEPTWLVMPTL